MSNQYKGTFRTIVDLSLLAAENKGQIPDEIQVFPFGEFMTLPYGPMKLDKAMYEVMIANHKANVRKGVPIDTDHDGGAANAWLGELVAKEDGGYAKVKWNKRGKELLFGR